MFKGSRFTQFGHHPVPQVFVANPKKPAEVTKILVNNKTKLIAYLENFHNDRVSSCVVYVLSFP